MLDVPPDGGPLPPKLLVGTFGAAPAVLQNGLGFLPCTVVRLGPEERLEERILAHRPMAVLLDAGELYLEGRPLVSRLQACVPGVRILFLDVDDTWALWMEGESDAENDLCITPCRTWEASQTALLLLRQDPPGHSHTPFEEGAAGSAAA